VTKGHQKFYWNRIRGMNKRTSDDKSLILIIYIKGGVIDE